MLPFRGWFRPKQPYTTLQAIPLGGGVIIPAGAQLGSQFIRPQQLRRWWWSRLIGVTGTDYTQRMLELRGLKEDGGRWLDKQNAVNVLTPEAIEQRERQAVVDDARQAADTADTRYKAAEADATEAIAKADELQAVAEDAIAHAESVELEHAEWLAKNAESDPPPVLAAKKVAKKKTAKKKTGK